MKNKIFALGFFDGVHRGHQALLSQCVRLAAQLGVQSAAITFDSHPQAAFTTAYPPLLSTHQDRLQLLRRYEMGSVCTLPVTREQMATPWQDFLRRLTECGAAGFVCGDDFRFGHKGEGDAEKLQAFCAQQKMPCVIVPEQTLEGVRISSTHIRSLLEAGDLETAEKFLGHRHQLTGTVVSGQGLGHTLGTPTANLSFPEKLALPQKGVYACMAGVDGKFFQAVTNIGTRPTVEGRTVTVEPWLLDFNGNLYGKTLTLEFYKFLRPEQKFSSLEELQAQILQDAQQARQILP